MNKKLPHISNFSKDKKFFNNKETYYSYNNIVKEESNTPKEIKYIFNTPVIVKTKDKDIYTTIIGRVDDHILTNTNGIIKIKDITDIKML